MRNGTRRSLVAVCTAALVATGFATGSASAQDEPLAAGIPTAKVPADGLRGKLSPRLVSAAGRTTVFVELTQQAAVDAFNAQRAAGKDRAREAANNARGAVAGLVDAVLGQLRSLDAGTRVLYSTANAVAGVVVRADAAKIRELAARPDVASIRTVVPKTRGNAGAAQLTNTLTAWQRTGRLGDGVRVGIIDDGIDYTHADFGGPGTREAYDSVDRDAPTPLFPNAKVVGGTDLVGDDYDAGSDEAGTPKPDPNPIACGEHGTHVAGTVGGYGVAADGSTFTGDYATLTPEALSAMRIGPGMAPRASLYAIKVFGCEGSTDVTAQALDWALDPDGDGDFDDHLDIVNLSLGSDYGAPDDPDSLFVRKLAANDVLAVIAEGNGGDLYDVGGSPGNTPEALTVASSRDASVLRDAAEVTAPSGVAGAKGGQYSQSFTGYDTFDRTAPVVKLSADNADGCEPYSDADKAAVAGRYAWLEWDDNDATRACGSGDRADNAEAAGAAGVLLSSSLEHFAAGIAGNSAIPMFQFTASATGQIRPALDAGTLTVRLLGAGRASLPTADPAIVDTPSSFTSRGVRGPAVKPDVSAPGDTITSALRGSGDGRTVLSGTSMATPLTSGVTALLRQAHPDWTVEEIKALVMNTAGHDITEAGRTYAPQRVGAGRVDTRAALDDQVLAYSRDDRGAVSVTFGTVEVDRPVTLTKTVQVINKGDDWARYTAAYEGITNLPGVEYSVGQRSVTVPPHGSANVRVTLRISDPTALRKVIDPTVEPLQADLPRQFVADASGRVVLTPLDGAPGPALRVPVYAAPKPVSDIDTPKALHVRGDGARLALTGRGVDQGTGSRRYQSMISVVELQGQSPRLPDCRGRLTEGCAINDTARAGDLQYVGAASTAAQARQEGHPEDALLAFGISTWGDWANLGSNTIPFVDIDTTGDGAPDFEAYATKQTGTDVWVVNTVDLNAEDFPTVDVQPLNGQFGDVDTNAFDTNVALLPVSVSALGIDPNAASHPITYTVGTTGYYTAPGNEDGLIDAVDAPMTFDALAPAYSVSGVNGAALVYAAQPRTALRVTHNPAAGDTVLGLLALMHHNGDGDRVSVIRLNGADQP